VSVLIAEVLHGTVRNRSVQHHSEKPSVTVRAVSLIRPAAIDGRWHQVARTEFPGMKRMLAFGAERAAGLSVQVHHTTRYADSAP